MEIEKSINLQVFAVIESDEEDKTVLKRKRKKVSDKKLNSKNNEEEKDDDSSTDPIKSNSNKPVTHNSNPPTSTKTSTENGSTSKDILLPTNTTIIQGKHYNGTTRTNPITVNDSSPKVIVSNYDNELTQSPMPFSSPPIYQSTPLPSATGGPSKQNFMTPEAYNATNNSSSGLSVDSSTTSSHSSKDGSPSKRVIRVSWNTAKDTTTNSLVSKDDFKEKAILNIIKKPKKNKSPPKLDKETLLEQKKYFEELAKEGNLNVVIQEPPAFKNEDIEEEKPKILKSQRKTTDSNEQFRPSYENYKNKEIENNREPYTFDDLDRVFID